jgi:two-component system CAI-1 autoinducer sensor kinase/phosphatase CqsS
MHILGVAGAISLVGYYFIWRSIFPTDYENLLVRLVGAGICIPAILWSQRHEHWFERFLTPYWVFSVTYVLPFVFGFMLIQNAAHATTVGSTSFIWPMQNVVSLVLFIFLINNGVLATLLWIPTTIFLVGSVPLLNANPNWEEVQRVFFQPLPLYAFVLVVGSLTIRNREVIDQEKLRAVASVGSTIAHELRTPLLGIRALAEGIQMHLQTLVDAYERAAAAGLAAARLRRGQLVLLRESLDQIQRETEQSNSIIEMLLINSAERPLQGMRFDTFSIRDCIVDAVDRYPFSDGSQKNLVKIVCESDFFVRAPRVLITHVFFNLIKNALYYISKAGYGAISINISRSQGRPFVTFEDTGTGIAPEIIGRIFDRFFTTTEAGQGSGIGLTFCKMVIEGVGGRIVCSSEQGRFTRFTLTFASGT